MSRRREQAAPVWYTIVCDPRRGGACPTRMNNWSLEPEHGDGPLWKVLRRTDPSAAAVLRHFGIIAPSVPVEDIARSMGVTLEIKEMTGSGEVRVNEGHAFIGLNKADSRLRRRFTAAHELGHLMLHPTGELYHRDTNFRGANEVQANRWAANLLMPFWMIQPLLDQGLSRTGSVVQLAQIFEVSIHAMEIRLDMMTGRS